MSFTAKQCTPVTACITEVNNPQTDEKTYFIILMLRYNSLQYSNNSCQVIAISKSKRNNNFEKSTSF